MSPNEYLDSLVQQGALPPDLRARMDNPNFQGGVFQRTGGPEGPGTPTFMYRQDPTPSPAQQSLADARGSQFEAPKPFDWGPQVPTMADVFGTDPQAMAYGEQLKAQLLGPAASQYQLNQIPLSQLGEPGQAMLKQFEDRKKREFDLRKEEVKHFEDTRKGVAEFGDAFLGIGGSQGAAPGPQGVPGVRGGGPLKDAAAELADKKFKTEQAEKAESARKAADMTIQQGKDMVRSLADAEQLLTKGFGLGIQNYADTGLAGLLTSTVDPAGVVSNSAEIDRIYTKVRGAIARDTLQKMREASPTGGALGAISERELAMLEGALGVLSVGASRAEQIKQIRRIRHHFSRVQALIYMDRLENGGKLRKAEQSFLDKFLKTDAALGGTDPELWAAVNREGGGSLQEQIARRKQTESADPAQQSGSQNLADPNTPLPPNLQQQYEEYARRRAMELRQ